MKLPEAEKNRAPVDSVVGIWDVGGERITVSETLKEGLRSLLTNSADDNDRAFVDSTVGVWEVDGERITVSETFKGGLLAIDSSGKEVGAGMVFAGRKVSQAAPC